jgi:putative methanogenesis marker protein 17
MAALDYFEVECPEAIGGECYSRIAADVLQDQDLLRVVAKLHIYIDPTIPLFIAVGTTRKLPGFVKVEDFAQVHPQEGQVMLSINNEVYLAPLLERLWKRFGKENVDQPDRFTVIIRSDDPEIKDINEMEVSNPSESIYLDLLYGLLHIAPEGFKVRRQQFWEGKFYLVASEDTLPEDVVQTLVREKFLKIGVQQ